MQLSTQRLDEALLLLDEMDATPLNEMSGKLDRIYQLVLAVRVALEDATAEEVA